MTRAMNVAAIDIGTNSVRLLILDSEGRELEREMNITRLGQGVDQTGRLGDEAVARTMAVLGQYQALMARHGVQRARVTATSAARDSSNRDEFFAQVKATTGFAAELLPGSEEARLSFFGATRSFEANPKQAKATPEYVVFDIGGGSTEFARGRDEPDAFLSLDMGSVRITERFLHTDPPQAAEIGAARAFIVELLGRVQREIPLSGDETWIGVAGTVTTFASRKVGAAHYDAALTHGTELSRTFVETYTAELLEAPLARREQLLLEKKRAPVIAGGALILSCILEAFALPEVLSSERDILDGLAASLL
jgi:exopolyphosphatase/guanosine-5'-triphosphate,3'-diphosphate pyrophosphatase